MSRPTLLLLVAVAAAAPSARAQQPVNPIHPAFAPLDASGRPARSAQELSPEKTCGACHDVAYISAHSDHAAPKVKASCVQCHLDGGRLDVRPELLAPDGRLKREAIRIGAPRAASCGPCHGVVSDGAGPVVLPADFERLPDARGMAVVIADAA